MSAFGKRNGIGGSGPRPSFGVARPMKGGGGKTGLSPLGETESGGDQFPPLDELTPSLESAPEPSAGPSGPPMGAMDRLNSRQNASGEAASSKQEGFEASVHRIKEQVLPRLLERVDPEAAATLGKDELAEEFRPIISEVLAELKINLNRREQFALERCLSDDLLGLERLEELPAAQTVRDIMATEPDRPLSERPEEQT